jgi:hypothetical protein
MRVAYYNPKLNGNVVLLLVLKIRYRLSHLPTERSADESDALGLLFGSLCSEIRELMGSWLGETLGGSSTIYVNLTRTLSRDH